MALSLVWYRRYSSTNYMIVVIIQLEPVSREARAQQRSTRCQKNTTKSAYPKVTDLAEGTHLTIYGRCEPRVPNFQYKHIFMYSTNGCSGDQTIFTRGTAQGVTGLAAVGGGADNREGTRG